jgi:hypothetical protein
MATREQNERRFPRWENLPDGGRRYIRVVRGKAKGYAQYVKIVDANEVTISIVQEVYNDEGHLIATHQKYPEDTGHQDVTAEGDTE